MRKVLPTTSARPWLRAVKTWLSVWKMAITVEKPVTAINWQQLHKYQLHNNNNKNSNQLTWTLRHPWWKAVQKGSQPTRCQLTVQGDPRLLTLQSHKTTRLLELGPHYSSKKTNNIYRVIEDLSRNSLFSNRSEPQLESYEDTEKKTWLYLTEIFNHR